MNNEQMVSDHYAGIGECVDHGGTKNLHSRGYARIRYGKKSQALLHRIVYAESNGIDLTDIDGLLIHHRCDNPRCINPNHLLKGTDADNRKDATERDRAPKGSGHSNSKLSESDVIYCREDYVRRSKLFGSGALAEKFGVSPFVIPQAVRGLSWRHV